MKIEQKGKKFEPVTITLETEAEVQAMVDVFNVMAPDILDGIWQELSRITGEGAYATIEASPEDVCSDVYKKIDEYYKDKS